MLKLTCKQSSEELHIRVEHFKHNHWSNAQQTMTLCETTVA